MIPHLPWHFSKKQTCEKNFGSVYNQPTSGKQNFPETKQMIPQIILTELWKTEKLKTIHLQSNRQKFG